MSRWPRALASLAERLAEGADVGHAVSDLEARRLERHFPQADGKIAVLPNGVCGDVLAARGRGPRGDYLIYAGRIERYKRLETAVELAAELARGGAASRLLIVGGGPHAERVRRYAERGTPGLVEFSGPLPREEYIDLLSRALATVNPSEDEAYSIFTAEALAAGVPAAVSRALAEVFPCRAEAPDTWRRALERLGLVYLAPRCEIKAWEEVVDELARRIYGL
ncbi:glycosyltransferase family 4 protein [Thermoproteus tenax]|uniref:Glycosyltransferase (Type 1) n=1 Tax=Thermoproteus tenax (strain ATCC 35583 / DSM 2078 / JCM 9277 / NBRC 100435 / Kra 1) TaxID=768679 RepID=G4RK67_THETK|nr:glycosyltransferase [Thermoproteus tenax]CCC81962.1 glycosyltransferase (type 1) [Thermoproteus tenax Kra 1]